ncbi:hypothetical protein [Chitinophaga arvensicola]|uniref:Uncharacterized protein n=1 Tax=Chitinophaga arvensicola TaxID=29529 RepID=A0A1I0S679_9BACT|nr:hypothetical protein [Chitinophaga arvensicola]SEW50843.1 hypothetical protein SAMN04488122_3981 [Chitinophaga arvensicola]
MSDFPKRPIPSDTGAFISLDEMTTLTKNHDDDHVNQKSFGTHVKAMCFGKDKIIELLDQPGATALRIYYGIKIDTDGDGIKEKKMILVAVDEHGNDILPSETPASGPEGIVAKGAMALILDSGMPCPEYCSKPKKPGDPD